MVAAIPLNVREGSIAIYNIMLDYNLSLHAFNGCVDVMIIIITVIIRITLCNSVIAL